MLMLFHIHLILERGDLALHQQLLFGELLPFALGIVELELRFERIGRRFDRTARIQARDDIVLAHGLPFGDIEIGELAVDRRIETPHFRFRRERALRRHHHVRMADERPHERRRDERHHREDKALREPRGLRRENRDAFGAVFA